ncbi:MAG: exo-alpha-sialidase [Cyanobacteria bacterium NC_groundwater_1444_Ag_S-0.65um_54_12]|nr:exo-alpha-sialidase [Cyanobacteria bacterium NC_groundwater_1444_Ag_S-0.65um_54_12]
MSFNMLFSGFFALAVVNGCGIHLPPADQIWGNEATLEDLADGGKAIAVVTGPAAGISSSLWQRNDGTWAIAYGSEAVGDRDIFFATSNNSDGKRWNTPNAIAPAEFTAQDPVLFGRGEQLHLLFSSNRDGQNFHLYETSFTEGSWQTASRLELPGSLCVAPAVTSTPDGWLLAYQSSLGLMVAESIDGTSWENAQLAATRLGDPALAQVGDRLVLVAQRNQQLFELSRTASGSWSIPSPLELGASARQPYLASDATGRLVMAYARQATAGSPYQIAMTIRDGHTWRTSEIITNGSFQHMNPALHFHADGRPALIWGIEKSVKWRGISFALLTGLSAEINSGDLPATTSASR